MEIDFKKLIGLQELDEQIRDVSHFLDGIPARIKDIDQKIEHSVDIVNRAKDSLSRNQKKRRDLEAEAQDEKLQIDKYKRQLNNVKTNKEYSSFLKEIEDTQRRIEQKEEQIIEEMLAADEIETEIRDAERQSIEIKEKLLLEKEELDRSGVEKESERKRLMEEKERISPDIPPDLLKLYSNIYKKMGGTALSPVTDDFCSMCQIRVRPQVLNELIAQTQIILCENCGRILYWVEKAS